MVIFEVISKSFQVFHPTSENFGSESFSHVNETFLVSEILGHPEHWIYLKIPFGHSIEDYVVKSVKEKKK
jgi:hypothetical protein